MLVSPGMDDSVRKSLVSQPVQVMPWIARTTCSSAADTFSGSEFDVYFPFRLSIRPPLSGVFPLLDPCEQHESSMGLLFAWTSLLFSVLFFVFFLFFLLVLFLFLLF